MQPNNDDTNDEARHQSTDWENKIRAAEACGDETALRSLIASAPGRYKEAAKAALNRLESKNHKPKSPSLGM